MCSVAEFFSWADWPAIYSFLSALGTVVAAGAAFWGVTIARGREDEMVPEMPADASAGLAAPRGSGLAGSGKASGFLLQPRVPLGAGRSSLQEETGE